MSVYGDIETAQTYFDTRMHTDAWDDLGDSDDAIATKNKALAHATRIIDRLAYKGLPTDEAIAAGNKFPQIGTLGVPSSILESCYEIALSLLDGIDPELELQNLGQISSQYANIKSTRDTNQTLEHILAGVPSQIAWRMLRPYLADSRSVNLVRGS